MGLTTIVFTLYYIFATCISGTIKLEKELENANVD